MTDQIVLREPTADEIAEAQLPARYEKARSEIAACVDLGELKQMSDKQAALAVYFKLSQDTTLHNLALGIQLTAERRIGQVLTWIPNASAANLVQNRRQDATVPSGNPRQDAPVPSVTRTEAATSAGLSERRRKTCLNLANIPDADFQQAIESASPLPVTRLAEYGRATRAPSAPSDPLLLESLRALRSIAEFCNTHDTLDVARVCHVEHSEQLRSQVLAIRAWLDQLLPHLGDRERVA